ncbi:hypothetical protein E8E14_014906 [Neopestalotiopsis sp. 37M]|nr:hypothetical protein E8E14_014906 [Neopestalotiopsis sp. 37M]
MSSIGKWIKHKVASKKKRKARDPQLPTYDDRLFVFAARQPVPATGPLEDRIKSYGLFSRLPTELRQEILKCQDSFLLDDDSDHLYYGSISALVPDTTRSKHWHWSACVCHRTKYRQWTPHLVAGRSNIHRLFESVEPFEDQCLQGFVCSCQPDELMCRIDSFQDMNWLLVCRQAYSEAIDLIYGTNTFHISSLRLWLQVPQLIPWHLFNRITSLELTWYLDHDNKVEVPSTHDASTSCSKAQSSSLLAPLDILPTMFPRLRKLFVSFRGWCSSSDQRNGEIMPEVEAIIEDPVESVLRAMIPGPGKEFHIGFDRISVWNALNRKYGDLVDKDAVLGDPDMRRGKFWKSLDQPSYSPNAGPESVRDDYNGYWIWGCIQRTIIDPHSPIRL